MKILVVTQVYPTEKNLYQGAFIHTRSLFYKKNNLDLDVISFSAPKQYVYEDINIYTENDFQALTVQKHYNTVIFHAPNLRNHIRFFLMNFKKLPKIFFIFHGHEILKTRFYYPEPFSFKKSNFSPAIKFLNRIYDAFKCLVLKQIITKFGGKKISFIFVSEYLKNLAVSNIGISLDLLNKYSAVIHNPVSPEILECKYDYTNKRDNICITIRPYDESVYAIDKVLEIAEQNPDYLFHIYGVGEYFDFNAKPVNVEVFKQYINPAEFAEILNKYKAAIMLSHHDSQGVMATEMAYFGIPLVVSDIPAAREMFGSLSNINFIDNKKPVLDLDKFTNQCSKNEDLSFRLKMSPEKTIQKEIEYIKNNI